jgi:L-amino acid N-acyltransferase YncA
MAVVEEASPISPIVLRPSSDHDVPAMLDIYFHPDRLHVGVGCALLTALIQACASAGFRHMIGYIDGGTVASLRLHEACGFRQVGYLSAGAFRFFGSASGRTQ